MVGSGSATGTPGRAGGWTVGHPSDSTADTLLRALQYYLRYEPEFVALFFPDVAARKQVLVSDVVGITWRQADSLRPLLADSVLYFRRQLAKGPGRASSDSSARSEEDALRRKEVLWTTSLRELCTEYGLDFPL